MKYHVSLNKTFNSFLPERKKYLASFSQYPPIHEISSVDWGEGILCVPEKKRWTKKELNHLVIAEKDIYRNIRKQTIWTVLRKCVVVLRVLLGNYCFFSLKKASLLQEHGCFDEISNSFWCPSSSHSTYITVWPIRTWQRDGSRWILYTDRERTTCKAQLFHKFAHIHR